MSTTVCTVPKSSEFSVKVVSFTKHLQEDQKLYLNMESSSGL